MPPTPNTTTVSPAAHRHDVGHDAVAGRHRAPDQRRPRRPGSPAAGRAARPARPWHPRTTTRWRRRAPARRCQRNGGDVGANASGQSPGRDRRGRHGTARTRHRRRDAPTSPPSATASTRRRPPRPRPRPRGRARRAAAPGRCRRARSGRCGRCRTPARGPGPRPARDRAPRRRRRRQPLTVEHRGARGQHARSLRRPVHARPVHAGRRFGGSGKKPLVRSTYSR